MTGRMNGAPSAVISSRRPGKRRRASARAVGTASAQESSADRVACRSVKRIARDVGGGQRGRTLGAQRDREQGAEDQRQDQREGEAGGERAALLARIERGAPFVQRGFADAPRPRPG